MRGGLQVILQSACQFPGFLVLGTESQVVVLTAHPDFSVRRKPVQFICGEKCIGSGRPEIFLEHLLVVVAVLFPDPVHCVVQFGQKIRGLPVDRKEEIRRSHLDDRHCAVRISK